MLISSTFLLVNVENQNLYALTSGDRYTSGFSHGEHQAAIDFQNNIPFNPLCVEHTTYYCAGYLKGNNAAWKANGQTSDPNSPASNSTSPSSPASNTNTTATKPHAIISQSRDIAPFIIFVILVLIIAAIVRKFKGRRGKHKERHPFPDSVKEKVLEKQHHRRADCNLNVVDWHHRNGDRSDNRESNCVALCPNCHAIKTRRHSILS